MLTRKRLLSSALPALLLASTAYAVRPPDEIGERPLEPAQGPALRSARPATYATPAAASRAFARFVDTHGRWTALWDADTAVPTRLWGEGIAAPGAMADAAVAEAKAREVLAAQLDLLAPGARVSDFTVAQNVVRAGVRNVVFQQRHKGLEVLGARVRFSFKHDRLVLMGSTAAPHVQATIPSTFAAPAAATSRAKGWIEQVYGKAPAVLSRGTAAILPLRRGKVLEHAVVVPVEVDLTSPRGQWTVWVDAATGEPVARRQNLLFAQGTVNYHVPPRHPDGGYQDYPAAYATHMADGVASTADGAGLVTWASTVASSIAPGLTGTYATVTNASGALASTTLNVAPNGTGTWDLSTDERGDAQLTAYVHATIAKRYAIDNLNPDLAWLHQQIPVFVNENDVCNAYSQLDDIHFFVAGSIDGWTCGNTARLSDVVYHEFGHSLHGQSFGFDIDGPLSEGISDYYAATINNDPAMGLGFFANDPNTPLRHIDPIDREYRYPEDFTEFPPHDGGLIIGSALWDLRKALVVELGAEAGVALADDIFYGIISRADDIPSSYAEALVTDDDDGNLANGTPHKCTIDGAFGLHGLGSGASAVANLPPPALDGLTLTLDQLPDQGGECPSAQIESVVARWQVRGNPTESGTVTFTASGATFTGTLPSQPDGTVLQYQVDATLSDGSAKRFPANPADGWYELYVGPVTEIYCTDFEDGASDWTLTGFAHGAAAASPDGTDPEDGFAGPNIVGTVLGGNYLDGATMTAVSPEIDVTGFENVRLQYRRWLAVEDAAWDDATIAVDGTTLWNSLETPSGTTHHIDREWRFQDLDLTAQAADGTVQVTFALVADEYLNFGGWNLDQVCIVAQGAPAPACGDGTVDEGEACDDGNVVDGDGCDATCEIEGGGEDGGCCSTNDDGATGPLLLGFGVAAVIVRRRRRRAA